ncbi:hypothetical protein MHU86_6598 [Fragilaria crotonensis]|nr:hypothetical protein MHU86_6598 [Fragilaria crotonensis]
MVVRRSSRKAKELQVEAVQDQKESEQAPHNDNMNDDEMVLDGATAVSKRSTRALTRESKKKRSDDLRAKSVGLVGKIDTKQTAAKKIIFRDDELADETVPFTKELTNDDEALDDDDDDGNVEEVKASVAKEQVVGQMQLERKTAIVLQKIETKRKRKAVDTMPTTDDAMDEDFFAKLDAELDQERRDKKQAKIAPKGKKTTFISREETENVVEREHNIAVVVLGSPEAVAAATGTKPSQAALLFSRSKLQDGISTIKKTGISKNKPAKKEGWRRSHKTTRILASGRKQRRSKPAAHFVIHA